MNMSCVAPKASTLIPTTPKPLPAAQTLTVPAPPDDDAPFPHQGRWLLALFVLFFISRAALLISRRYLMSDEAVVGVMAPLDSYRTVVILYAALGVVLGLVFSRLSAAAESPVRGEKRAFHATFAGLSGLDRSHDVVLNLSALFALDSFGGGFVVQSFAAYWFYLRFGVNPQTLGAIFFWYALRIPRNVPAVAW
jgi:hypothetical protein